MPCAVYIFDVYPFAENTVYMTDAPPPYPGINGFNGYAAAGAAAAMPSAPAQATSNGHDAKAASASQPPQQGWYDPAKPNVAYLAGDAPPTYEDSQKKKND